MSEKSGGLWQKYKKLPRWKRYLLISISLFVIYSATGFLAVPLLIEKIAPGKLTEALSREVTIENVYINPYLLSVEVDEFEVRNREGDDTFVGFHSLFLDFQISSLFRFAPIVRACQLSGFVVQFSREDSETYNFSDLLSSQEIETRIDKRKKEPPRFSINNIEISDSAIYFDDQPYETLHEVEEISFSVPFLSNLPSLIEIDVEPSFSAIVNGRFFTSSGQTRPFAGTQATTLQIELQEIDLPYYLAYMPIDIGVEIKEAVLDSQLLLAYSLEDESKMYLGLEGEVQLSNIELELDDGSHLFSLPRLTVEVKPENLLEGQLHLAKIELDSPVISLARRKDGSLHLPQVDKADEKEDIPEETSAKQKDPFYFSVDEVRVLSGAYSFIDQSVAGSYKKNIDQVNIDIKGLTTLPDTMATYSLDAQTAEKEELSASGSFGVSPLNVDGKIFLSTQALPSYAPYYRSHFLGQFTSGAIDFNGKYVLNKELQLSFSDIALDIVDLALFLPESDNEIINIPEFSLADGSVNLEGRHIRVGTLNGSKIKTEIIRFDDGSLNINELTSSNKDIEAEEQPLAENPGRQWQIEIREFMLDDASLHFEDQSPSSPVPFVIDQLAVSVNDFWLGKEQSADVNIQARVNGKGLLDVKGGVAISPLHGSGELRINNFEIGTLQGYVDDYLHLLVTDGKINISAQTKFSSGEKGFAAEVSGSSFIDGLATVDPNNGDPLYSLKKLDVQGFQATIPKNSLQIKNILLDSLESHIVISQDGTLNVQKLLKKEDQKGTGKSAEEEESVAEKGETSPLDMHIGEVKLKDGQVFVNDFRVTPDYHSRIHDLNATLTGIAADVPASLTLTGEINNTSSLSVSGTVQPLSKTKSGELELRLEGVDLSRLTPYSGKYLGRSIRKGKLSLSMDYVVDDRSIDGKNTLFFDQFTLGDNIESEDAVSLPLDLAIALMQNRKGEIKLNVPVEGNLDDPAFSIGGVVMKVVMNMIVKAATSPFALIGALVGSDEELDEIYFQPGVAVLDPAEIDKLDKLATVLVDRPGLKLELTGFVDPEPDRKAIHETLFWQQIKARKLEEMVKKGGQGMTMDTVTISDEEYEKYLWLGYKAAPFKKEKNFIGMVKKIPPGEQEKLLREFLEVDDDKLATLASKRASSVSRYFIEQKQIESERIFLVKQQLGTESSMGQFVLLTIK